MEAETSAKVLEYIKIGIPVKIQRLRTEKIFEGNVTTIFDSIESCNGLNPDGIEVEIDDHIPGNVKVLLKIDDEEISRHELLKLIQKHERKGFELKSSFKYDVVISNRLRTPTAAEYLRRKVVEEVASFMNTDGGILCIGVDDKKNILGLENDFKLQSDYNENKDKSLCLDDLQGEIKQALIDYLDDDLILGLFDFVPVLMDNEKTVLCITVKKSPEPVFVKIKSSCKIDNKDKKQVIWKCWIRVANGIQPMDFSRFMVYWEDRR